MGIMQQSSKAQDRTLGVWFHQIDQGAIKLPRFQRFEAWDRGRITSFLNTIINNLPVGVTLVLEVAGPEKFVSRYIRTAERTLGTVTQNLLDGQQRLTAFWRAVHSNYEGETFFVHLPEFDQLHQSIGNGEIEVRCVPRWINKNKLRMPRWAEDPVQCFERGLIPIALLRPGDLATDIDNWLSQAAAGAGRDRSRSVQKVQSLFFIEGEDQRGNHYVARARYSLQSSVPRTSSRHGQRCCAPGVHQHEHQ